MILDFDFLSHSDILYSSGNNLYHCCGIKKPVCTELEHSITKMVRTTHTLACGYLTGKISILNPEKLNTLATLEMHSDEIIGLRPGPENRLGSYLWTKQLHFGIYHHCLLRPNQKELLKSLLP